MKTYSDIVSPDLKRDSRINRAPSLIRRIFRHEMYEILVCVYLPTSDDLETLIAGLIVYKEEHARILVRLDSRETTGSAQEEIKRLVGHLKEDQTNPLQLVRDAKIMTQLPLTLRDRAAMRLAGVDTPRES